MRRTQCSQVTSIWQFGRLLGFWPGGGPEPGILGNSSFPARHVAGNPAKAVARRTVRKIGKYCGVFGDGEWRTGFPPTVFVFEDTSTSRCAFRQAISRPRKR
jgi:hypothetical protein